MKIRLVFDPCFLILGVHWAVESVPLVHVVRNATDDGEPDEVRTSSREYFHIWFCFLPSLSLQVCWFLRSTGWKGESNEDPA